jgi:hypothetical protein
VFQLSSTITRFEADYTNHNREKQVHSTMWQQNRNWKIKEAISKTHAGFDFENVQTKLKMSVTTATTFSVGARL